MENLSADVGHKMKSAVKAKLIEMGTGGPTGHMDDELPDYVMIMVANKRSKRQMTADLSLFLGDNTAQFVDWLYLVLQKLQEVAIPATAAVSVSNSTAHHRPSASARRTGDDTTIPATRRTDKTSSKKKTHRSQNEELSHRSITDVFAEHVIQNAHSSMVSSAPMKTEDTALADNNASADSTADAAASSVPATTRRKEISELAELLKQINQAKKQLNGTGEAGSDDGAGDDDFISLNDEEEHQPDSDIKTNGTNDDSAANAGVKPAPAANNNGNTDDYDDEETEQRRPTRVPITFCDDEITDKITDDVKSPIGGLHAEPSAASASVRDRLGYRRSRNDSDRISPSAAAASAPSATSSAQQRRSADAADVRRGVTSPIRRKPDFRNQNDRHVERNPRERDAERNQRERDAERNQRERDAERNQRDRDAERNQRDRGDAERNQRARDAERHQRERDAERIQRDRNAERLQREREADRIQRERDLERIQREREAERIQRERNQRQARIEPNNARLPKRNGRDRSRDSMAARRDADRTNVRDRDPPKRNPFVMTTTTTTATTTSTDRRDLRTDRDRERDRDRELLRERRERDGDAAASNAMRDRHPERSRERHSPAAPNSRNPTTSQRAIDNNSLRLRDRLGAPTNASHRDRRQTSTETRTSLLIPLANIKREKTHSKSPDAKRSIHAERKTDVRKSTNLDKKPADSKKPDRERQQPRLKAKSLLVRAMEEAEKSTESTKKSRNDDDKTATTTGGGSMRNKSNILIQVPAKSSPPETRHSISRAERSSRKERRSRQSS